ncbi:kinase-like protein [Laetiporus sulphureus 93-53]|uniref:non-specific serine/threonine protein kinase n=1 Tax=Laetiporus sulphureus 93-53 TaxID=1314785 RepID=A0A165E5I5_9APHY|nr:kinase-like protein [Laetiporus sulphureus 93-53]KZT06277.1 kinase-like protein [Laetiporus sulphureus 93-53]
MAPKQPCAKYEYVVTPAGPKILPVADVHNKDEESPADYNAGGYLQIKLRDTFKDGRYVVLRKLGWGHFSTVWLVKDNHSGRHSALKVVKSAGRYAETARDEIKLLKQVREETPEHPGRDQVVSFLDSFNHPGPEGIHVCMVFEPLGENLLALIERHRKTGVAPALVKVIARQVLLGLEYLHDECDLVHTDIKPENIMIAIPDVELHIQAELSRSPSPTCRKVGVPRKQLTRTGLAIPRVTIGRERERHVQIFDSQPLSSPSSLTSYSAGTSPNLRPVLQMSRLASTQSIHSILGVGLKSKIKQTLALSSTQPDGSPPELSDGSTVSTDSVLPASLATSFANDTAATSMASVTSEVNKLLIETRSCACGCACIWSESTVEKEIKLLASCPTGQHAKPANGPSLLSQTAPYNLHNRNVSPLCTHGSRSPSPQSTQRASSPAPSLLPQLPVSIKIADLGNATPSHKHYTEDIQTRQYRSPEVILGRTDWGPTADVWSAACMFFELLTAEYLFDPQSQGGVFGKDDDHMAQIIELLGDIDAEVKFGGRFSRELFDSTGALRYIRALKPWPLKRVMVEKYSWNEEDAEALCEFLEPMLVVDHRKRTHARDVKDHKWLEVDLTSPEFLGW